MRIDEAAHACSVRRTRIAALRDLTVQTQTGDLSIPNWAVTFDHKLKDILEARDTRALLELWPNSDDARRAHPTPDHFLPAVYKHMR